MNRGAWLETPAPFYISSVQRCYNLLPMQITSSAFEDSERIPENYTCDGGHRLSPPLAISDVPEAAQTLALIVDDPDIPEAIGGGVFTHWALFNIPPETTAIPEGAALGTSGSNSRGDTHYSPPCPPPGYEPATHRYFFKLYALDAMLDLPKGASKEDIEAAMGDHILETAELVGTYSRG